MARVKAIMIVICGLALLAGGVLWAAEPDDSCTYPTSIQNFAAAVHLQTFTVAELNAMRGCLKKLQSAVGAGINGSQASLVARLDGGTPEFPKLGANNTFTGANTFSGNATFGGTSTFNGNVVQTAASTFSGPIASTGTSANFKYLNGALVADDFSGADIGAKINNAIANCDAAVGAGAACMISLRPVPHSLSTSISVTRDNTTIDCHGGTLTLAAGLTNAAVRFNVTAGTLAAGIVSNVGLQHCFIDASAQTAITDFTGSTDIRYGAITAYKVNGLQLNDIKVTSPIGHGVWVSNSSGMVSNIRVSGIRRPGATYANDAYGVVAGNANYSYGSLRLDRIVISTSEGGGINLLGYVQLQGAYVTSTALDCIDVVRLQRGTWTGAFDPRNSITISNSNCTITNTAAVGSPEAAISVVGPTTPVGNLLITGVQIASPRGNGFFFENISSLSLTNSSVGCWNYDTTRTSWYSAVTLNGNQTNTNISGNTFSLVDYNGFSCPTTTNTRVGIEIGTAGSDEVTNGPILISGNSFLGSGDSSADEPNIVSAGAGSPEVTARVSVSGNFFGSGTTTTTPMIDVIVGGTTGGGGWSFVGNTTANPYGSIWGQLAYESTYATSIAGPLTIVGNSLGSLALNFSGSISHAATVQGNTFFSLLAFNDWRGVSASGNVSLMGSILPEIQLSAAYGCPSCTYGDIVCADTTGFFGEVVVTKCTSAIAADKVAGMLVWADGSARSTLVRRGYAKSAKCNGTINVGDKVGRSPTGGQDGKLEAISSPSPGEVLGRALTTCSSGVVTVDISKF